MTSVQITKSTSFAHSSSNQFMVKLYSRKGESQSLDRVQYQEHVSFDESRGHTNDECPTRRRDSPFSASV